MANEQSRAAADTRRDRWRQYEIDRITARYVAEYQAGRSPLVEDYAQRYPDYAQEIRLFVADYLLLGESLPEPDAVPVAQLSPAALAVLGRIANETPPAPAAPLAGLIVRGMELRFQPPQLAAAVGISLDVLAKLDARAIEARTVPATLIERLAVKLQAMPASVTAFLVGTAPTQSAALFYAEQPPEQRQETFLDAIQASALDERTKQTWAEIIAREVLPA